MYVFFVGEYTKKIKTLETFSDFSRKSILKSTMCELSSEKCSFSSRNQYFGPVRQCLLHREFLGPPELLKTLKMETRETHLYPKKDLKQKYYRTRKYEHFFGLDTEIS